MTNKEHIQRLSTWDLAKLIYDISENNTKITNCDMDCHICEYSDSYCISEIGEWLNDEYRSN